MHITGIIKRYLLYSYTETKYATIQNVIIINGVHVFFSLCAFIDLYERSKHANNTSGKVKNLNPIMG